MKFNLTDNIIFNKEELNKDIEKTLKETNEVLIDYFNAKGIDLDIPFTTTTFRDKNNSLVDIRTPLVFNKIVKELLQKKLDKEFIYDAFALNQVNKSADVEKLAREFHNKYDLSFSFGIMYASIYEQGLGVFLMLLHFKKLIHLPFKFKIPYSHKTINEKKQRVDFAINAYPKMFQEIRGLNSQNNQDSDSKFLTLDNKEILISYGSKLFLGLGWVDFKDVDVNQMLEFRDFAYNAKIFNTHPPYQLFITLLSTKCPNDFPINLNEWLKVSKEKNLRNKVERKAGELIHSIKSKNASLNQEKIDLIWFSVDKLNILKEQMPEISETISLWEIAEKSYLNKIKRENVAPIKQSLNHLNIYLFYILHNWYKVNYSKYGYPKSPKELKGNVFISRVIETNELMPPTFVEFLEQRKNERKTANEYQYSVIKNISQFFDFIQTYSDDLEGCKGFVNSISDFDLPRVKKSMGTNKGLIPRHLFGFLINYIEIIKTYNQVVLEKVLEGKVSDYDVREAFLFGKEELFDTVKLSEKVGFIPLMYWNGERVVFKELQNLLDFTIVKLKNGKPIRLPRPHLLNHVYVALQTGIRGNHIQWLDAEKFNQLVKDRDTSFVPLYVNTDKAKNNAWSPMVHKKVLETLENQLAWRNLIDNPKFNEKIFYNNNDKTKWGSFYPLFSYGTDGLPYSDNGYKNYWLSILVHFQNMLPKFGVKRSGLARLLPTGISFNEINQDIKLKEYGASCKNKCELRWTSDITPHSARVSVVSHYITALPADIIGQYITGQTEAVVHHYVKLDPQYLTELENGQRDGLAKSVIQKEFDGLTSSAKQHPILTDKEDSHLRQSMLSNRLETIANYGCISLNLREEGKSGVDVLIENANIKLAFNKTEICPYDNHCPSDLIKEMKGIRRCGICPYAVRSIDHLPAIAVKKRQMMELLEEIENKLASDSAYTIDELNNIEEERQRITEELLGWIVSEEMLEANRQNLQSSTNTSSYVVKKPEILMQNLQQVALKENDVEYLLTRLADCENFPSMESPLLKARLDLLRRQLLARLGDFKKAFDMKLPTNATQECLGVLKEVVSRYGLTQKQTVELLSTNMALSESKHQLLELSHGQEK